MPRRDVLRALVAVSLLIPATWAQADGDPAGSAAVAAPFSWTGFYVGAQLGGLGAFSDVDDPRGSSIFGNPNVATGAFAGGQVGYNYQSGMVVYGVEADVAFPQVEGTSTCSSLSGQFINSNCKVGINAFGSLTGRIGLALGPDGQSLIYGKGGAAWSSGGVSMITNDSARGQFGNPFTRGHSDLNQWGWTLGAGAEQALSGGWSVKAEYDYANFGKQTISLLPSEYMSGTGAAIEAVPAREGHLSQDMHLFKLGLNYRFGGNAREPVEPEFGSLKDQPVAATGPYGFEVGGRYWYSWGRHKYDLGQYRNEPVPSYTLVSRLTYDDLTASTGEVTGRLTAPWSLFAKGFLGGGSVTGGHMNDEDFNIEGDRDVSPGVKERIPYTNTLSQVDGSIPWYGTVDVGYDWWRTSRYRFGTYAGYNYYAESYDAYGVQQLANQAGPFGADVGGSLPATGYPVITQRAKWQSVRLGATAEFYLAPGLKLIGDAAYLPYVSVNAVDHHYAGNSGMLASTNPLEGHGVGTQLEVMLAYDVTDRWSVGVGGRYWAMWTTDAQSTRVFDSSNSFKTPTNPANLKMETERLGVLGEVTYKFD